jgi:Calx-beta domain
MKVMSIQYKKTNLATAFMGFLWLWVFSLGIVGCSSSSSTPPPVPVVTFTDATVVEGDSGTVDLVFTANLDKSSSTAISITYATVDVTATAGTDYAATSGTLQIAAGASSANITVTVNGDTDIEPDETFTLNLTNPTGATLAVSSVTGTITSDDHANPSAYYTGSADVINPNDLTGNTITLSDLRVMVSGNRIMMMNTVVGNGDQTILYDTQNMVVNGNTFTADVTIYINMHLDTVPAPIQSTISGTITENASIVGVIGTANDTVAGTGSFTTTFSTLSNTPANSTNIAKTWDGPLNGRIDMAFKSTFDSAGNIGFVFSDIPLFGIFASCRLAGTVLPINSESLYTISLNLTNCSDSISNGNYTGFSIPSSLANDVLVFAFSNGSFSGISLLPMVP